MVVFGDIQSRVLIGTSRKVMTMFFHLDPRYNELALQPVNYFLARNPYDRAVSLYFQKFRLYHGEYPDKQNNRKIMSEFTKIPEARLSTLPFAAMVQALPHLLYADPHFWPQTKDFAIAHTGQVVKIEEGLPALGAKLGIDFTRKANVTVHPPWHQFIDPASRKTLAEIYAADFSVFGYEP